MPTVFISWSGESSKSIATTLYNWLPVVLQTIRPFMSSEDLKKGGRWQTDLTMELAKESFGIVCLTPTNLVAPWILFESGALSKSLGEAQVAPFLVGVKPSDLAQPLTQFNAVLADKADFKKLLRAINDRSTSETVQADRIDKAVDGLWPQIEAEIKKAEEVPRTKKPDSARPVDNSTIVERIDPILQELLLLNRQQSQLLSESGGSSRKILEIQDDFQRLRERDRDAIAKLVVASFEVVASLRDISDLRASRLLEALERNALEAERRLELYSPRPARSPRRPSNTPVLQAEPMFRLRVDPSGVSKNTLSQFIDRLGANKNARVVQDGEGIWVELSTTPSLATEIEKTRLIADAHGVKILG